MRGTMLIHEARPTVDTEGFDVGLTAGVRGGRSRMAAKPLDGGHGRYDAVS